jgi:hypothetical protein
LNLQNPNKMSFTNNITTENKTYTDGSQKPITNVFAVAAHFVLAQIAPENKYQTHISEFNLKQIGTENVIRKVKGGERQEQAPVYFKDEPLKDVKYYKSEAWEKKEEEKKNKPPKPTKTVKKTAPKKEPVVVKLDDGRVEVTREVNRTKFMAIGKPIRYIVTSIMNYYVNELIAMRSSDVITPERIEKEGKISKFITNMAKTIDIKNTFDSSVFGEYSTAMGDKFDKCYNDVTKMVTGSFSVRDFSPQEIPVYAASFACFLLSLVKECSIYRSKGQSVNENSFYSAIISCYGRCENLGFDIKELETALKLDSAKALLVFKKVTAPKKTAGVKAPPKKTPAKKTPAKKQPEPEEEEEEEDFDLGGDDDN